MTDDTRSRIVFAAMELFWEKGFASTSIADVLKRSDANSGSLYHFFPGKQDLLLAVLQAYRSGIDEMLLQPAWGHVKDPIERIFALLARYRELVVQTECFYGCPIGSLALELHEPDPSVRELLAANFLAWTEAVQRCIVEAGERLRKVDSRELAEFVLTTMEGAVMSEKREFALDLGAIAECWRHGSVVRSWLLDLTTPLLADASRLADAAPVVADSGEGRWTAVEAIELGVPTPVMSLALMMRFATQGRNDYAARLLAGMGTTRIPLRYHTGQPFVPQVRNRATFRSQISSGIRVVLRLAAR